ncbi:MAG TPA: MerR family transcriptional regulator [Bacillus bacterium]|nr:MerR family transcriptional regulator [Bacillus sp. (in: firmicutes)]
MTFEEGKYNMKAVSKLLGIQPGTLRAWERRYKMIAPNRNEAGHRLYSERHIIILKWLLNKINEGFTISQAVALFEESEVEKNTLRQMQTEKFDYAFHEIKENLLQALLKFEEDHARKIFDYACSLFSIETAFIDLTIALFAEMEIARGQKKVTTVHEQYIFNFMRSKLGAIVQTIPYDSYMPETALLVTGPNEKDELGLLLFALFLRWKGYKVIYLGTSVKEEDLSEIINEIKPKFLFASFTINPVEIVSQFIDKITANHVDMNIGIGGQAIQSFSHRFTEDYQQYIIGPTRLEWEKWLKRQ